MKRLIKNNRYICFALVLLMVKVSGFSQSGIVRTQLLYDDNISIYLTQLKHIPSASYTVYLFFPNFHGYSFVDTQEYPNTLVLNLEDEQVIFIQVVSDIKDSCHWETKSYTLKEYRRKIDKEDEQGIDTFMDYDFILKNLRNWDVNDRICTELYNNTFKILLINFPKGNHIEILNILKNIKIIQPEQIKPDSNVLDRIKWDRIEQAYCFLNKIHSENFGIIKDEYVDYIKIFPINLMKSFFVPQNFWYIKNFSLLHYNQAYISVDTTDKQYLIKNNSRPSFFYVEFSRFYNGVLYANVFYKDLEGVIHPLYFSYRFSYNENGYLSTVERIKVYTPN